MPFESILTSDPPISVLLPVRDGEAFLGRALDSLARQTWTRFEVIVADDGSEDDTRTIARRHASRDDRIRVLDLPRAGISPALQTALSAARGEWIVRQDADDVSHPRRVERLLEELARHPDVDVVGSRICGFPYRSMTEGMRRYESWQNELLTPEQMRLERFVESPLAHASALIRRSSLEHAGGWTDVPWPEDLDLWLRMFRMGRTFRKVPEVLYFWAERPERTTRTDARLTLEAFRACKLHYLEKELLCAPSRAVTLWSRGRLARTWSELLEDRGYAVRAVDSVPAALKAPLLVATSSREARAEARAVLQQRGAVEDRDFLCIL